MKKYVCIVMVLVLALSLSGCAKIGKVLYPSARTAEFYYDRVDITREDIKDSDVYKNLFLHEDFDGTVSQNAVRSVEDKQKVKEEVGVMTYAVSEIGDEPLNQWLKDCDYIYEFSGTNPETNRLTALIIKSKSEKSTYQDYLNVMKALTVQFGECTTEMYRSGDATINTVMVSLDIEDTAIIDYYSKQFDKGSLYLQSKWVLGDREVRVFFDSPSECGVVYVF